MSVTKNFKSWAYDLIMNIQGENNPPGWRETSRKEQGDKYNETQ